MCVECVGGRRLAHCSLYAEMRLEEKICALVIIGAMRMLLLAPPNLRWAEARNTSLCHGIRNAGDERRLRPHRHQ